MKKIIFALLFSLWCVPLWAQEIRLDSLWVKFGGYPVMAFSPDSRVIVLGSDILEPNKGAIRFLETQTGKQIDSMMKVDFIDFAFSPFTKQFIIHTRDSLLFHNGTTFARERSTYYNGGGYISFSSDSKLIVFYRESGASIIDSETGQTLKIISRPTDYKIGPKPNETRSYWNGKVACSNDGTKLYGKREEQFGYWDLTAENTPFRSLFTIGNRAIIGFTPDKKYMIQQSNYIWDIEQKNQIDIPGRATYESQTAPGFATTPNGSCIAVTKKENHSPLFINPYQKRVIAINPIKYSTIAMLISPDSMYFAMQVGSDGFMMQKMNWMTTQVLDNNTTQEINIKISPLPSSSAVKLYVETNNSINNCSLDIFDNQGILMSNLHKGFLPEGITDFTIKNSDYSTGIYTVRLQYGSQLLSTPFIIRK